jgi:3-deoxy-manno-octulosonate cytidylyltransferase (CMP-KDO synthetase)
MSVEFHVIIPARYQSTRLPGKLLMELKGMTVLERVYRQVLKARPKSVIIATDNAEIYEAALSFGAPVEMTAMAHQSGTDRIAELVARGKFSAEDIIVNVQGDEPLIDPALISQIAEILSHTTAPVATLCWPEADQDRCADSNVVKVVRDSENHALYFSRSRIPFYRELTHNHPPMLRHIGLYAYRAGFLLEFVRWPVCELETAECLEQLRVLWAGYKIKVEEACTYPLQDINTLDDLESARRHLDQYISEQV